MTWAWTAGSCCCHTPRRPCLREDPTLDSTVGGKTQHSYDSMPPPFSYLTMQNPDLSWGFLFARPGNEFSLFGGSIALSLTLARQVACSTPPPCPGLVLLSGEWALTSGLKGGSSIPAPSRLKFSFLKRGCSFTSRAAPPRQPRRSAGSLQSSCGAAGGGRLSGCPWEGPGGDRVLRGLPAQPYLGAERAGLWGEALRVLLGHLLHQPLHLLPLDLLFPLLEG